MEEGTIILQYVALNKLLQRNQAKSEVVLQQNQKQNYIQTTVGPEFPSKVHPHKKSNVLARSHN